MLICKYVNICFLWFSSLIYISTTTKFKEFNEKTILAKKNEKIKIGKRAREFSIKRDLIL